MSNFTFIKTEWPSIYAEAAKAEQHTLKEPRYAAILCRSALERAIYWIYENDADLELPYNPNLNALMFHPEFKDGLRPSLFTSINLVRKVGNNGAHGTRVDRNESTAALKGLFMFVSYLSKLYSLGNPEIHPFSELLLPVGEEGQRSKTKIAKLAAQLEAANDKLAKNQEANIEKAEENAALKKQLDEARQKVTERKEKREEEYTDDDIVPNLLSEAQTRTIFIDVLLREAGWDLEKQDVKEFPVVGMPKSTNPSGNGYVDYVLWGDDGLPLAVVEAKKTILSAKKGKRQAEQYADCLQEMYGRRPIIYYSNGFEHYMWDELFYPERMVAGFCEKDELELLINRREERLDITKQPIDKSIAGRPYQYEAIKRVTERFMKTNIKGEIRGGQRRALLVMATGTGKTRTAAAFVDMMTKANWVKRVLFLADRNALVTQAKNAFNEHVSRLSAIDLTKEKEDEGTRVVFSTYPTIMNRIDGAKTDDQRFYGVGHFDLIIVDEAHRSVYSKYRAIFEYFDSLVLGLTATPVSFMDRNTYELFDLEDNIPTFAYELDKAVEQKFLNPPKGVEVPLKFPREGVKYSELSDIEKEEYEEKFGDPTTGEAPDEISSQALNKWLFNGNTIDQVLIYLMQNGHKVGGESVGKSIIFAANHKHAVFIEERFNKLYPEYGGKFLRVIDNYEPRAQDLLEKFCDKNKDTEPIIAVSVDMMDTGIDAPRAVNLVFFKRVYSATKYWQMIGRGTRLCPDLFGPGQDKKDFYIFDFCENFNFFGEYPEGIKPSPSLSLSHQIFIAKLEITEQLLHEDYQAAELKELRKNYLDELHGMVTALDRERFEVRNALQYVVEYEKRGRWENLSRLNYTDIITHLGGIADVTQGGDEFAKRFDLLVLKLILYVFHGDPRQKNSIGRIMGIGQALLKKLNIPAVKKQEAILRDVTAAEFWSEVQADKLEQVREALRDLTKYLDKEDTTIVYTNFLDELNASEVQEHDLVGYSKGLKGYKARVEAFLRKNDTHITIQKLKTNKPVTEAEIDNLEKLLFDGEERGTKEDFAKESEQKLGVFIRSIFGLDTKAVQAAFADFLHQGALTPNQITFINTVISYLTVNGTIDKRLLFEAPPFNDMHDQGVFGIFEDDQVRNMMGVLDMINNNAEVG
ncbi:MAG: restriction endonuclease [Bacteroidetes bacterium]|nr:MAG: restriction endonuclease [Bacteroidota bacterium]